MANERVVKVRLSAQVAEYSRAMEEAGTGTARSSPTRARVTEESRLSLGTGRSTRTRARAGGYLRIRKYGRRVHARDAARTN